jgi:uncharacterized protein YjbI with pentapeptide repeats
MRNGEFRLNVEDIYRLDVLVARCRFETDIRYYDYRTGKYIPYLCTEPEENNTGLCVFHDENYLKDLQNREANEQNLRRKLSIKLAGSESLICIGYHLPDLSFEELQFDKSVNFSGAEFTGSANFCRARFTGRADFTRARFTGRADFRWAQFNKEANFQAEFREANFHGAHFTKTADFSRAQFRDSVEFHAARFTEAAYFSRATFRGIANFYGARFEREANFRSAHFTEVAYFTKAHFTEIANFPEAQFIGEINLSDTRFTGEVSMSKAEFRKRAVFYKTEFAEKSDFSGAKLVHADFPRAQFSEVDFSEAQFSEVDFSGTQFTKSADFYGAYFSEVQFLSYDHRKSHASFSGAQFAESAVFRNAQLTEIVHYRNVQLNKPEQIIFVDTNSNDLSQVSFLNTDISRARFGENVKWGNDFKILEERQIEISLESNEWVQHILLGPVFAVYRNLRENYEFRLRYDEAGELFIREMEMKRRYEMISSHSWKNIFRLKWRMNVIRQLEEKNTVEYSDWISRNFSLTGLYYHLSKYGQSFSRPALFGVGIVLFSTLLWLTQPNPAADFSFQNITIPQIITIPEMDNKTNIQIAFERGLTNFLPSLSFGTELNVGLLDVAFKIVGGAVTFGLIIIALRRKFERKFRH